MKKKTLIEGQTFARKCDATGQGMNEGYCFNDGEAYFINKKDALAYAKTLGFKNLDEAYEAEAYYHTAWEDEEDFQYIVRDGKLAEIEEEVNPTDPNSELDALRETEKNVCVNLLDSLRTDCNMAISGEWDYSTDEGKEGFTSMIESIDRVQKFIK